MNFSWIPELKVGKRIEQLNFQQNIQLQFKATSPTIELLKANEKVKKIKEIFENGHLDKGFIAYNDHWMVNSKKIPKICEPKTKPQQDKTKEATYINDLIEFEKEHLDKLKETSKIFTKIVQQTPGYISKMVRDHHIGLSGFLEDIIDLHQRKILPKFSSKKSFGEILRFMLDLIENDLYLYVSHTILYNSTFQWLDNYKLVLNAIYREHDSYYHKLEIDDIIGQYRDWISDVCDELSKNPFKNADDIALCMDVEHKFDRIMEAITDGKKVAYIKEVAQNNIEAIDKIYQILSKKEIICHPMLILVPRHDSIYGYRNPIDILKLGQFVRVWSENLYSDTSRCYFLTNLFIFERCIIYTIIINENNFVYNGHFWIKDCEFETVMRNDKPVILAYLWSGDRRLLLDNSEFVSAVMRLHAMHKYDDINGEIDLPFNMHVKILSKIEISCMKRMSLAASDE